jgi:hypothetical protein
VFWCFDCNTAAEIGKEHTCKRSSNADAEHNHCGSDRTSIPNLRIEAGKVGKQQKRGDAVQYD